MRAWPALNSSRLPVKKNYILDTNVLLHDPNSLLRFEDNCVLLPIEVIEEIDRFKRESTELGQNARAALITRGLAEMTRLVVACGGRAETMAGLAGLGDLVLTCTGGLSRNRTLGTRLGKGEKLEDIMQGARTVAEGVKTAKAARDLAQKHGIDMPIVDEVYQLLYEGKGPKQVLQDLMTRELKGE